MIKKNLKKTLLLILLFSLSSVFLLHITNVSANIEKTYSVNPLFGNLPVERGSGYFQLNVEPYTSYRLPLLITNNTDKPVTTKTFIRGAQTSDNGHIVYNMKSSPLLSHITDNKIKKAFLKPHSSKVIRYNIYTAQNMFYGTQLAAIVTHFSTLNNNHNNNSINYINGLSLTEHKIKPNLSKLKKDELIYDYHNGYYKLRIKNEIPTLFQHLKARITIKDDKVFNFNNVGIAPNSSFNFILPTKKLDVKNHDVSVKFNDHNIEKKNNYFNYKILCFLIFLFIIILFTLCLFKKGER